MVLLSCLRCVARPFVNTNVEAIVPTLEKILGGAKAVLSSEASREHHGHDESFHSVRLPDVVVEPTSVQQVCDVVRVCSKHRVPVIPYGTGTGFEGGVTAPWGGVCIDLQKLDEIVEVNAEDFDCTVQPGVTRSRLNSYIHDTGLWFPIDPGSDASLCGMCATGASGTNAVRYGTMREDVVNLEVVLPDGTLIHTRGKDRRTRKTSAGYNLTNLFVGSEGTLGVITQATLRLFPYPEQVSSAVCAFPDVQSAVQAVSQVLECSVPVARIEFLDDRMIEACNKYSKLDYVVQPTIFLEFHGNDAEVARLAEFVGDICKSNDGGDFLWSSLPEERKVLWKARHDAWYATMAMRPGCKGYSTDVCVPFSRLTEVIVETKKDIEQSFLFGTIVGHVGDGNFHCFFGIDQSDPEQRKELWRLSDKIVKRALAANGTCTGEHGVGLGKIGYLQEEMGAETVALMKRIKRAVDPHWIMNPGKVFVDEYSMHT